MERVDVAGTRSIPELLDRIAEFAATTPGEWP